MQAKEWKSTAWTALGIYLAAVCGLALLYHYPLPYFDHFILYFLLEHHAEGTLDLKAILDASGEHWLLSGYAIQLPLAIATHWNLMAEVAVQLLLLGISALFMLRHLYSAVPPLIVREKLWAIAVPMVFLLFSLDQASNLFWGWQMAVYTSLFSLFTMCYLLDRPQLTAGHVLLAMLAALPGIYGFSTSYALLPVGLFLMVTHPKISHLQRGVFALSWLVFCVVVLGHRLATSRAAASLAFEPSQLVQYSVFVLLYLGAAITRFAENLALPVALLGVGSTVFLIWRIVHQDPSQWRHLRPFLAYILYSLGAGLIIAVGRLRFGVDQALIARYITFGNLFWMGFTGLLGVYLMAYRHMVSTRTLRIIIGLAVILMLLKTGNMIQQGHKNIVVAKRLDTIKTHLLAGQLSHDDYQHIYNDAWFPKPLSEALKGLKKQHLAGF